MLYPYNWGKGGSFTKAKLPFPQYIFFSVKASVRSIDRKSGSNTSLEVEDYNLPIVLIEKLAISHKKRYDFTEYI